MDRRVVTVFGGSGFIGRQIVHLLASQGWTVRAVVRDPIAAEFLKPMGEPGQVNPIHGDVTDAASVKAAVSGAEAVVNLVGILVEKGRQTFDAVHRQGALNVAEAASAAGVKALVHLSALGADKDSPAAYARSKAAGEDAVRGAFPAATILRPSVVFGKDDQFFNRFAKMASLWPVLPVFTADGLRVVRLENGCFAFDPFGSGGPVFQPVYVGDVAQAAVKTLTDSALAGRTYELGGPRRYTLKEILDEVNRETGRHRMLVPVPFGVARVQAAFFSLLPNPPLTADHLKLMASDNVVSGGKPGLAELGLTATTVEAVVPSYLHRYRPVF